MLREYQSEFITNLSKKVAQAGRVIGCLPTGGGKTICFLEITERAIAKRTVLIITESKKIFSQIQAGAGGVEINAKVGSHMFIQPNKPYIAMAQTLARRPFILDQFVKMGKNLLIINDEAHIGTATKVLRQLPEAMLIGFTATPVYDSAKFLPEIYKGIVVGAQVSDLIQLSYLSPYRHYARVSADLDKLKLKNGEFTEESQKLAFENGAVFDGLLEDLRKTPYKKAMVFCSSISHAEDTYEALQHSGINCVRYHSGHELSLFDLFKFENKDDCNVCVSVAALNKGYDFPPIDLTCLLFSTTSLPRYLQSIGRASRIYEAKRGHISLDYGGNYLRHGLWDMDREYEKLWLPPTDKKKKTKDTVGVAAVKYCPECMAIIPTSTQVCPYCAALLREDKEPQQGDLIEITEGYTKMIGRHVSDLNPKELAVYARLKNKKAFAIRIARAMEQVHPGFLRQFAKEMNYNYRWEYHQREMIGSEKIDFTDIILK